MSAKAYYNEHDPFAAAWLRELIKAGCIAPGDVDERSIEDVRPDDLRGYTQCHFFAGIGVWSYALRRAGWPDDRPVWTGSCPCQPFSAAGKGGGFADERHLWPAFHWLIQQRRPAVVLGEQVASKDGLGWLDLVQADLEATGYASRAVDLCAAGVGAPHIRQRLWWIARRGVALGDAHDARLEVGRGRSDEFDGAEGRETSERSAGLSGVHGRMAHHHHTGQCGEPVARIQRPEVHDADGCGIDGRLGHAECLSAGRDAGAGAGAEGGAAVRPERDDAGSPGAVVGMADADRGQLGRVAELRGVERDGQDAGWSQGGGELEPRRDDGRPGPTNGIWRDADWLHCRDGKWRPVEPGTFPLAHGAAARVGRLRGYGNAINAEAAVAFIEACKECIK